MIPKKRSDSMDALRTALAMIIIITMVFHAIAQPVRIELEVKPNEEPFTLIPNGRNGIVILFRTNEFADRNTRKWNLFFYDSLLLQKTVHTALVPRTLALTAYARQGSRVAIVYYDEKNTHGDNLMVLLTSGDSVLTAVKYAVATKSELAIIRFHGDYLYLGMNYASGMIVYKLPVSGDSQPITKIIEADGESILDLAVDKAAGNIFLISATEKVVPYNQLKAVFYTDDGRLLSMYALDNAGQKKSFNDARIVYGRTDAFLISGSFSTSTRKRKSKQSDEEATEANGFYVASRKPEGSMTLRFLSFGEISTMIPSTLYNAGDGLLKARNRRKQVTPSYNLILHEPSEVDGLHLMCAELFTNEYRTVTSISYDYYGRPVPRSYTVFDGYRFSHAVVLAINMQGEPGWSSSIEMLNMHAFELRPHIVIYGDVQDVILAFSHEGNIVWKPVSGTNGLSNITYTAIELLHNRDRVTSEQQSRFAHWYKQYFLAWGYQTISNDYLPKGQRRSVFYVNKLAFD